MLTSNSTQIFKCSKAFYLFFFSRLIFVELLSSCVSLGSFLTYVHQIFPVNPECLLKIETCNYFRNPQYVFILWSKSASIHIWLTLFDVSLYSNWGGFFWSNAIKGDDRHSKTCDSEMTVQREIVSTYRYVGNAYDTQMFHEEERL